MTFRIAIRHWRAAILAAIFFTSLGHAQTSPGLDSWVDFCGVTDRDLLGLAEAEAAMFNGFLVVNLDGTYHLDKQRFEYIPEYGPDFRL